ncbi:MAG TPA: Nramp family divalent metal transporter [Candidatus Dormibacteraeota bacterium]|jgi:Mn2+/Fe2+ NRAMP family transporter|nr:Nramp family divalent metal transporter [Candidatus Dormibacteraeota bacterium]
MALAHYVKENPIRAVGPLGGLLARAGRELAGRLPLMARKMAAERAFPGAGSVRGTWRILVQRAPRIALLAAIGPGLVSGFADNDAGGITTYSVVGARFGYDLLWVVLASMIALGITQEVGARLGLATGQGLGGLVRERFGVRWASFAVGVLLIANLGDTVAEFAGIGAALALFGVPAPLSAAVAAVVMVTLLARGSFGRIQWVFLGTGVAVSIAYAVSAAMAHPDWGQAGLRLVVPRIDPGAAYLLAVMGTVGTTITPWGQAFIQSYTADKRLGPEHLGVSRLDITAGAIVTNVVAGFIVVACAATLWAHGQTDIPDAATAARALGPFAGHLATDLFAFGLLAASLLGLGTVPLTSTYTATEAFGWERGLHWRWREAPVFYGLLAFFVGVAALFVVVPGLPLIPVMFLSQVFDGLLLPIILTFVMLMGADRRLLGPLASGRVLQVAGWAVVVVTSGLSVGLVVATLAGA